MRESEEKNYQWKCAFEKTWENKYLKVICAGKPPEQSIVNHTNVCSRDKPYNITKTHTQKRILLNSTMKRSTKTSQRSCRRAKSTILKPRNVNVRK